MIAVIQCQGRKQPGAPRLRSAGGKPVYFVARPELLPVNDSVVYKRPDDPSDNGVPWRQILLDYNRDGRNPLRLYPAWRLYTDRVYTRLAERFGIESFYILSAGWGLIRADFLTPDYNITFSQSASGDKSFMRRRRTDRYEDFSMLPDGTQEGILFFGSKEYVPLFCALTKGVKAARTVFYNTAQPPAAPGCVLRRFSDAKRNTNWQFDCANVFLDGANDPDMPAFGDATSF